MVTLSISITAAWNPGREGIEVSLANLQQDDERIPSPEWICLSMLVLSTVFVFLFFLLLCICASPIAAIAYVLETSRNNMRP